MRIFIKKQFETVTRILDWSTLRPALSVFGSLLLTAFSISLIFHFISSRTYRIVALFLVLIFLSNILAKYFINLLESND